MQDMIVTIIGLGHIGGSLAIAIQENGLASEVWGIDRQEAVVTTALRRRIIDQAPSWEEAMQASDIVILATPVQYIGALLPQLLDEIGPETVVTDVGSTKGVIEAAVQSHPRRHQYVGAHPMAGTEKKGIDAAVHNLFGGKFVVLCEVGRSAPAAVARIEALYRGIGMRLTYLGAEEHDVHTAYVSHLSHVSAFGLALTVLEKERDEARIFELASSGFDSTVRLAKSNADMWLPIFEQNRTNLLTVLEEHLDTLQHFRKLLLHEDYDQLRDLMEQANNIRRILEQPDKLIVNP